MEHLLHRGSDLSLNPQKFLEAKWEWQHSCAAGAPKATGASSVLSGASWTLCSVKDLPGKWRGNEEGTWKVLLSSAFWGEAPGNRVMDVSQLVDSLPAKHEALGLIPGLIKQGMEVHTYNPSTGKNTLSSRPAWNPVLPYEPTWICLRA